MISPQNQARALGYLSAAPRVTTDPQAEASGPRSHVLGVIDAFQALGWEVHPFIVGDRMPKSVHSTQARDQISGGRLRTLGADFARLGMSAVNRRRAWQELGETVTVVYERFALLQALGPIFQRHGIPWILETSGPFFYEAKSERNSLVLTELARRKELAAYRNCDVLVCVSQSLKELILEHAAIEPDKIAVIPNGVDTDFFDPTAHSPIRLQPSGQMFTVGYVGSVIAWQSLDLLLQATAYLRHAEGLAIQLVIVGDGPARSKLVHLADDLKIGKSVTFAGLQPRATIPSYIAGFDIGYSGQNAMQIGRMYHSPLKLYEYLAMGKPVLASAYDDATAATQGGEFGQLFEPGDLDSLIDGLRRAYQQYETSKQRAHEIRCATIRHHSWRARIEQLLQIMEDQLHVTLPPNN